MGGSVVAACGVAILVACLEGAAFIFSQKRVGRHSRHGVNLGCEAQCGVDGGVGYGYMGSGRVGVGSRGVGLAAVGGILHVDDTSQGEQCQRYKEDGARGPLWLGIVVVHKILFGTISYQTIFGFLGFSKSLSFVCVRHQCAGR